MENSNLRKARKGEENVVFILIASLVTYTHFC